MGAGLVLGAGGPVGWAYHLGVLDGVRDALGVEPANAQRIVGTSAGGAIAASLLAGASSDDVLESIAAPLSDDEQAAMRSAVDGVRSSKLAALRPLAPGLAFTPWRRSPLVTTLGLLPGGVFPTVTLRRFPAGDGADWPEGLWMPSVRMDTGERVVFGRDTSSASVLDALEATSAVPGMFRPKRIDGVAHVDGAVLSATHADLLVGEPIRRVVVSSVMTRPGRRPMRIRARRQLRDEVAALEADGARVVVVEPDDAVMAIAAGYPRRGIEVGRRIVAAAREQTVRALADRPVRSRRLHLAD